MTGNIDDIQIFTNPEFGAIRTVEINGEPWLVGKDVAGALGYEKPTDAVRNHVDAEDRGVSKIETPSGSQEMVIINESGLYSLVLSSKLPTAKRFKRWVVSEVIPSIRKHGAYMTPETLEQALLSPDFLLKLAQRLKEEQEARKTAELALRHQVIENRQMKPMADYFFALAERSTLTTIRETAKLLEVKERKFVKYLMDNKYLYRSKNGKLMPYADLSTHGLFTVKEVFDKDRDWYGVQTFVTPMGRETFLRLLNGEKPSYLCTERAALGTKMRTYTKVEDICESERDIVSLFHL